VRLRRPEMEPLFRLGCARGLIAKLVATELFAIGGVSFALALIGAQATTSLVSLW
jgi:hypothetical protein